MDHASLTGYRTQDIFEWATSGRSWLNLFSSRGGILQYPYVKRKQTITQKELDVFFWNKDYALKILPHQTIRGDAYPRQNLKCCSQANEVYFEHANYFSNFYLWQMLLNLSSMVLLLNHIFFQTFFHNWGNNSLIFRGLERKTKTISKQLPEKSSSRNSDARDFANTFYYPEIME